MLILVSGGSASGKSEFAEGLVTASGLETRAYLATMQVWDAESERRVERHRRMRAGKGFATVECPVNLAGAFAIICCGLYLLVFFAAWCEAAPAGRAALALALGPAFSRSLSGLFAVTLPNARGTGLLATFTGPMDAVKARGVLAAWAVLTGGAMVAADVRTGLAALVGAGLACVYYVVTARRQFGGVTGDLAGFFLQLCELGMVLCAAVGQRLEVLL